MVNDVVRRISAPPSDAAESVASWQEQAEHRLTARLWRASSKGVPSKGTVVALLLALSLLVVAQPTLAQQNRVESMVLKVFPMKHQPARQALPLVDPMLSPNGIVSFQQEDNALVVKDRASVIAKLEPLLKEFDHPAKTLLLELHLLRATRAGTSEPGAQSRKRTRGSGLPEELVAELGNILSLNRYEALGSTEVLVREGEVVNSEVGPSYKMTFEVGTALRNRFLKLSDFRVLRDRSSLDEQVFHSSAVNIKLNRPSFVTISRNASSTSGLVVAFLWKPLPNPGISPVVTGAN